MTDYIIKILAIPGSVRTNSFNRGLLEGAKALNLPNFEIDIYDGIAELPIFSEDREGENLPVLVAELDAAIRNADAVLISTPEYNGSLPGGLKNLLDWGSRPRKDAAFNGKPVAVIGASPTPYGAARSVESTNRILNELRSVVLEQQLTVGGVFSHFDDSGELLSDDVKQSLESVLLGLRDLVTLSVAA